MTPLFKKLDLKDGAKTVVLRAINVSANTAAVAFPETWRSTAISILVVVVLSLSVVPAVVGQQSAGTRVELRVDSTGWLDEFLGRLDPASAPARLVSGLGQAPTRDQTVAAVAGYFRSRPTRSGLWAIPMPDETEPSYSDSLADLAVGHLITTRAGSEQYGDTLPWFSPTKKLTTLSRFPHFDYLAPAYFHTHDERYAAAMVRDMIDFIDHVPTEMTSGYNVQTNLLINPWNWVLLQWRVKRWLDALEFLRDSSSLSDEQYLRIVNHIWTEIDWLVPRKVLGLHNGTLGNVSAILYTAIVFPEAARSETWMQDAGSFYLAFLDTAFYPGEFLVELTLGYSEGTLKLCIDMFDGLPATRPFAAQIRKQAAPKLEAIVDAHVGMMKPDRSIPRYGDHGIFNIRERLLLRAGRLFDRGDWLALAQDENNAVAVEDRQSFPFESNPYYLSGYYAMRDGWDVNANYLSMDAGPFGTNHHHGDKLSLTVSGDGAAFIVDPGTALYTSIKPGPRIDLRPGFLHNNITIDGIDVNTGWDRHYGFDVLDNRWVTNHTYDFLEGVYEYRNNLLDVIWRRSVLFLKGEYFVVMDALLGEGEHAVESNLQMDIGVDVDLQDGGIVATAPNGAKLSVASAEDGLTPTVVLGDTTARPTTFITQYPTFIDWVPGGRGWVGMFGNESPREFTQTYPAPALLFSGTVELPHESVRVLSPSQDGELVKRTATWLERTNSHWVLEVRTQGSSVVDVLDWRPAQRKGPRIELDDDSGYWYRVDNGRVSRIVVMNADNVRVSAGGETIAAEFAEPFEGVLTRTEAGWTIFADRYLVQPANVTSFTTSRGKLAAPGRFVARGSGPPGVVQPGETATLEMQR